MKRIFRLLGIIALFLVLASALLPSLPTLANPSVETLRPNAAGDVETIPTSTSGAGNHWQDVDDVTPDESTTRVRTSGAAEVVYDLYNLSDHSVGSGTINFIKVYVRVCYSGEDGTKYRFKIKIGGTEYDNGSDQTLPTSYTTYSNQWTTNPQTGVAWTWTQIDALQAGIYFNAIADSFGHCTQVYVEVDYTPATTPTVTTSAATSVTATTAKLNGNVTATGGENPYVTVYWGLTNGGTTPANWGFNSAPTSPSQPQGVAAFYKNVTGLSPNTLYYFSAKATNSGGTGWGTTKSFTTLGLPTVTTQAVSDISYTTATGNGTITATGGVNATKRGVCWNTAGNPTVSDSKSEQTGSFGTGAFTRPMTGLLPETHYYVRAYAYNSVGYGYGSQVEFDTYAYGPPAVTSQAATNVEETTATWNGNITSTGGVNADYRGFVWDDAYHSDPEGEAPASSGYVYYGVLSGNFGTGAFTRDITDLTPGTTWYYRACAHNTYGWDYSVEQVVYTKPGDPSNLVATAVSSERINLTTWTKGSGAEKTMIRRKTVSYPTSVTDGVQVYFDTGTSAFDDGLYQGTTYFYRAWAWDENSGYSDGYASASATTPIGELHLALWIQWEYATPFHDLSGYDNDAAPTFRITSSNNNVSATFQNFRPIKEAVCTAGLTEEAPEMLTGTPEMPAEFYTEGSVNHLPGAALINNLLDAGGIPYDLFWIPFCFGLAAVASVLSYYFLRSMMFIAIIGGVIILFFGLTGAIPLWTFLIFAVIAGGVLVSERTFGW